MRSTFLLLTALALSGCGFHPRAQLQLPESLGPLVVQTADPYSPLGLELSATLERAGFSGAAAGTPSAALKITDEAWNTSPLSQEKRLVWSGIRPWPCVARMAVQRFERCDRQVLQDRHSGV